MLETEIKRLSDNISKLNTMLERMEALSKQNTQVDAPPTKEQAKDVARESDQETPAVENEQGYTTDDIKAMALAITRKDRSKRDDIKAKLAEHDAKIATDLTGDALQAVGEWLSALKSDLGV